MFNHQYSKETTPKTTLGTPMSLAEQLRQYRASHHTRQTEARRKQQVTLQEDVVQVESSVENVDTQHPRGLACRRCTFVNSAGKTCCEMCGTNVEPAFRCLSCFSDNDNVDTCAHCGGVRPPRDAHVEQLL